MSNLIFVDTETTSLRHDRRAWEIGLIVRTEVRDIEYSWMVDVADLDLGNADLMSLKIGRFHERHPGAYVAPNRNDRLLSVPEYVALNAVEELTRGAHLVGAVPNFDADVLNTRMRANGICPSWHYHLIDVEALMVGYLAGQPERLCTPLPWKSDDLAHLVGVETHEEDRHTALGDARWARDIYDAVTGKAG